MALTITINGKGIIANADGYSDTATSGSTWNELGGGADSFSQDTYLFGDTSFAGAYSSKSGFQYFDIGSGNELDFSSGGTEEGQLIFMPICCPTIGLLETIANKGLAIRIGTDQNNYREWKIAGSDDSNGWLGTDWKPFVIDPTDSGTSDTGTYDTSSIRYMGVWIDTASLAKGDNIFISQILVGFGLQIKGTSTDFWNDVISYCTDYPNRAYTMIMEKEGIGFAQGNFTIGDTSQTASTSVSGSNQTIKFARSEYWNGTAWVSTYDTTMNLIEFEENGTYDTDYTLNDSSISGANSSFVDIDTGGGDVITLAGGSTVSATAKFYSGDSITGHVFAGCKAIKPNGAIFDSVAINATEESTTGAIELLASTDLSNISNINFNGFSGKYALYIPASITGTITLDNFQSDGSGTDIYWAGTSGTLTVNKGNGTNFSTSSTAGGTVYYPAESYSFKFTLSPSITAYEWRIYSVTAVGSLDGATELDGQESATADNQTYTYEYSSDIIIAVQILSQPDEDYEESITYYTLSNANQNVTINLTVDDNN